LDNDRKKIRGEERKGRDNVGEKEQYWPAAAHHRVRTFARTETAGPGERKKVENAEQRASLFQPEQSEERNGPRNPGTFQGLREDQPVESGRGGALNFAVKRQRSLYGHDQPPYTFANSATGKSRRRTRKMRPDEAEAYSQTNMAAKQPQGAPI
jgi:hypothetical protein